jgi:hypothetical protein
LSESDLCMTSGKGPLVCVCVCAFMFLFGCVDAVSRPIP